MKVLDPQAALLTTGEIHEFLKSSKPRPKDRQIGSYDSVNLNNYHVVRQDLAAYLKASTPYVLRQSPSEKWMKTLLQKLKKYNLTKSEVFSLINLGVGLREAQSTTVTDGEDGANGDADQVKPGVEEDDGNEPNEVGEDEAAETNLNRMLFGLAVEESEERFPGDEGEQQVDEILDILKQTIVAAQNGSTTNGH